MKKNDLDDRKDNEDIEKNNGGEKMSWEVENDCWEFIQLGVSSSRGKNEWEWAEREWKEAMKNNDGQQ